MPLLSPHLDFVDTPTAASSSSSAAAAAAAALPPAGAHLVVSDTLTAPWAFVLFHLVGAAKVAAVPTIWLDIRNDTPASLDASLRRLGSSLPPPPLFTTISPSPLPAGLAPSASGAPLLFPDPDAPATPSLRPTFDALAAALAALELGHPQPGRPDAGALQAPSAMVILDGMSELVHMGVPPAHVSRFVRAAHALAARAGAAVVSSLHADHLPNTAAASPSASSSAADAGGHGAEAEAAAAGADGPAAAGSSDGDLLPRLLRLADAWWRVSGLPTGRSGDVSGEISCHALAPGPAGGPRVGRGAPLQFRLEVGGVKVFAKGTGRGFL